MKNNLSVKQNGFKDCASACLKSLMRYYNSDASESEISYLIKTDEHGTNAYNLLEGAKKLGFDGYGIKLEFEDLIQEKSTLPFIAHVKNLNMYHYIVIYEINKKTIKIMDPSYGIKKISYKEFKSMYLGVVIILHPVRKLTSMDKKDKIFKFMFNNIIRNKKILFKIFALSIILTILNIINNLYLKVFIDYLYVKFSIKLLIVITLVFTFTIFLKNIFDSVRAKMLSEIKHNTGFDITSNALEHILNLPYCYFKSKSSGEMVSRIDDLDNFKDLTSTIMLNIFVDILLMMCTLIVLIVINKTLFMISIAIVILYSLVVIIYSYIFKKSIYDIQITEGNYKKQLFELINGYETYKNLNIMYEMLHKVKIKLSSLTFKLKKFECEFVNQALFKGIINDIGLLLISGIGLYLVFIKVISLGDLIVFTSLILFFLEPIKELLNLEPRIRYAIGSYERINDLLMIKKEETNSLINNSISGSIKISNLSYSYNGVDYIFKDKTLAFNDSNKYLIYGSSGNGKSTLVKILLKYLTDYKGEIFIGGKNLKDIKPEVIRNSITYISQKEILLNDTIENNVKLLRNIEENEYESIIKLCKVDKIIDSHPLRENFLLEDNGFNISGGERQKIILARGLLKKSNIIILDEVLSEVGFDEEAKILEGILKKYEKNLIIYISHKEEIKSLFKYKYDFSKKGGNYVNQ